VILINYKFISHFIIFEILK